MGAASGSLTVNLRFPGQYFDQETGLHYNYFRDYDPETGRYVESDPIGLDGGLNTYGYVEGNPITFSDPLGLSKSNRGGGSNVDQIYQAQLLGASTVSRATYKGMTLASIIKPCDLRAETTGGKI